MTQPQLNECIIAAGTFGKDVVLAKNRDRAYNPVLEIVRKVINDTEVCLLHDCTTGWVEGMNAYGIGLVNSALAVGQDEAEKKIVKKTGQKSKDAIRVLHVLSKKTLPEAVRTSVEFQEGIKGHTIVANETGGVTIENTSKHAPDIKLLNLHKLTVRTNHGYFHQDAGYTEGLNYLSSKVRKMSAEDSLEDIKNYHEIARAMRKEKYPEHSMLNMARDDAGEADMSTTSQLILNLSRNEMIVYLFPSKVQEFKGLNNMLPEGYEPKIKLRVFEVKGR
jgi:hypothetical protein